MALTTQTRKRYSRCAYGGYARILATFKFPITEAQFRLFKITSQASKFANASRWLTVGIAQASNTYGRAAVPASYFIYTVTRLHLPHEVAVRFLKTDVVFLTPGTASSFGV